jgi:hypothetical protein
MKYIKMDMLKSMTLTTGASKTRHENTQIYIYIYTAHSGLYIHLRVDIHIHIYLAKKLEIIKDFAHFEFKYVVCRSCCILYLYNV